MRACKTASRRLRSPKRQKVQNIAQYCQPKTCPERDRGFWKFLTVRWESTWKVELDTQNRYLCQNSKNFFLRAARELIVFTQLSSLNVLTPPLPWKNLIRWEKNFKMTKDRFFFGFGVLLACRTSRFFDPEPCIKLYWSMYCQKLNQKLRQMLCSFYTPDVYDWNN